MNYELEIHYEFNPSCCIYLRFRSIRSVFYYINRICKQFGPYADISFIIKPFKFK